MFKDPLLIEYDLSCPSNMLNVGGITNIIELIPVDWIETTLEEVNKAYKKIEIAENSGIYSETMTQSVNGNYWHQEVSFDIPKNRPDIVAFLKEMNQMEWLVIITTKNYDRYLLGTKSQPLLLSEDSSTTDTKPGQNKRVWKFEADVEYPAIQL